MKNLQLIAILAIAFSISVGLSAQCISAHEQNKKLSRGVNVLGYDGAFWKDYNNGRFKESYFKMIREAGFSTIRVNLHTFSHMNAEYVIEPKWLDALDYIIKKGLEAKLMVILDMHEFNAMADDPIGKKDLVLGYINEIQ